MSVKVTHNSLVAAISIQNTHFVLLYFFKFICRGVRPVEKTLDWQLKLA